MSNDDFMLAGPRPRSRAYKVQRIAFNILAVAAFLECVGVAIRDLAHKPLWYRHLSSVSMSLFVVGVLVSVGAVGLGIFDLKTKGGKR